MPRYKYQTDDGTIVQIRLSEEKKVPAGAEPAGAIDQAGWFISVSTSKRSQTKRKARGFVYSREIPSTEPPLKLIKTIFLPILTPTVYNGTPPATVQYLGNDFTFVNKSAEG
jgi:hypothetical protein